MDQQAPGQVSDGGQVFGLGLIRTALLAAKLRLYQSSFVPTRGSLVAAFTAAEADFTGYAAATLVWSAVGVGADGNAKMTGSRCFFQATDAVAPNNIGGCWVEDSTGVLYGYWQFPAAVAVAVALAFVSIATVVGAAGPLTADVEN